MNPNAGPKWRAAQLLIKLFLREGSGVVVPLLLAASASSSGTVRVVGRGW